METQEAYEARERASAVRRLAELTREPLADRRAARAEWLEAITTNPALVAERAGWLLEGCYGMGEMILARQAIQGSGNVVARLALLIAPFEWSCPQAMARAAWCTTGPATQEALRAAIQTTIDEYNAAQTGGAA